MKGQDAREAQYRRDDAGPEPSHLRDFAGRWRLNRVIADFRGGVDVRMRGWVTFAADAGGLICDETGLLRYGDGPEVQADRRYLWRAGGPGRVDVCFEDGRFFHSFALAPEAGAVHFCAPDRYAVRYDFSGWPVWRAVWRVTGPRKDYESTTQFSRDPG